MLAALGKPGWWLRNRPDAQSFSVAGTREGSTAEEGRVPSPTSRSTERQPTATRLAGTGPLLLSRHGAARQRVRAVSAVASPLQRFRKIPILPRLVWASGRPSPHYPLRSPSCLPAA